jgi:hypothetical protein
MASQAARRLLAMFLNLHTSLSTIATPPSCSPWTENAQVSRHTDGRAV